MGLLDPVFGPLLIGTFTSVFAFGIMVMQCLVYFIWYKNDKLRIKLVVVFLLVLDTITVGFSVAQVYVYVVSNFDNLNGLAGVNVDFFPYPLLVGITALIVQCFFGWRIQLLTGSRPISVSIYIASTTQFCLSIGTTVLTDKFAISIRPEDKIKSVPIVWLSASLFTDLMITVTLVFWLHRNRTGFDSTDDLITRLIRMFVQTGFLTTSFASAVIITYLTSPNTMVCIALILLLQKTYTNSLLSTLNVRRGWLKPNVGDKLASTNGYWPRRCYVCDCRGALSTLAQAPPRSNQHNSATIISMHDMADTETQKSDAHSLTNSKINVLVESTSEHVTD